MSLVVTSFKRLFGARRPQRMTPRERQLRDEQQRLRDRVDRAYKRYDRLASEIRNQVAIAAGHVDAINKISEQIDRIRNRLALTGADLQVVWNELTPLRNERDELMGQLAETRQLIRTMTREYNALELKIVQLAKRAYPDARRD